MTWSQVGGYVKVRQHYRVGADKHNPFQCTVCLITRPDGRCCVRHTVIHQVTEPNSLH